MTLNRISRPLLLLLALGLAGSSGCRKPVDDDPYPLWFLGVDVAEYTQDGSYRRVEGCPRLIWRYSLDLGDGNIETCQDGSNYVRVYQHIDQTVTVSFRVECDGYFNSGARSFTFDPDSAVQRPGRGGPEVFHSERITLLRQ